MGNNPLKNLQTSFIKRLWSSVFGGQTDTSASTTQQPATKIQARNPNQAKTTPRTPGGERRPQGNRRRRPSGNQQQQPRTNSNPNNNAAAATGTATTNTNPQHRRRPNPNQQGNSRPASAKGEGTNNRRRDPAVNKEQIEK